jgi:hypothetical protein
MAIATPAEGRIKRTMCRFKTFHIKAGTWESARVEVPQHTHAFGVGFVVFIVFQCDNPVRTSISFQYQVIHAYPVI